MTVRDRVREMVESRRFQYAIMLVIVLNAATLGAETAPGMDEGLLGYLDLAALTIFVIELLLKFYAYRGRFFRDPWNCFDLAVVSIALMPASGAFAVLRALRVLRLLRLISVVPSMRRVVSTLLAAVPGVISIVGLLVLMIYISAVMATNLFREVTPQYFGSLGKSLWTLFQVMTGEAWPDIANEVMEQRPLAWIFFLVFILISSFVMLNLFLAVMVGAMERVRDEDHPPLIPATPAPTPDRGPDAAVVLAELAALRQEVTALREHLLQADAAPSRPAA